MSGAGADTKNVVTRVDALHPFAFVTRIEIGPGTEMLFVLVVFPFDQRNEFPVPATIAVRVVKPEGQIPRLPETEMTGKSFTVTITGDEVLLPQAKPSSFATEYVPDVFTLILSVVAPVLHVFPPFLSDLNQMLSPLQNVVLPLAVITGGV